MKKNNKIKKINLKLIQLFYVKYYLKMLGNIDKFKHSTNI